MKLKAMTRASVVAAGVAVAGLSLAIPASANTPCGSVCTATHHFSGTPYDYEAQVNNDPGNGHTSWLWLYTNWYGDHVDYYLEGNGNMQKQYTGFDSTSSWNLDSNVTAFRVCGPSGLPQGGDVCSGWYNPSY